MIRIDPYRGRMYQPPREDAHLEAEAEFSRSKAKIKQLEAKAIVNAHTLAGHRKAQPKLQEAHQAKLDADYATAERTVFNRFGKPVLNSSWFRAATILAVLFGIGQTNILKYAGEFMVECGKVLEQKTKINLDTLTSINPVKPNEVKV